MKKIIFTIVAMVCIGIVGCQDSNEDLVQERGTFIVPTMSDPAPAYFTDNLEESFVQFDLSLPAGASVDKVSIEVVSASKKAILKDVTLPITGLKVTASEVISALGIAANDYKRGDIFTLYVLTTKNGVTTRSPAAFNIPVVCYFEPSMLVGNFYYVSSDWDEEGSITIEADPDDPLKVYIHGMAESQGLTGNGNGIELNINPNNFNVTGPQSIIADNLADWGMANYLNHYYTPVSGNYSACDDKYTITFLIGVSAGNWGNNVFILTRE